MIGGGACIAPKMNLEINKSFDSEALIFTAEAMAFD